MSLASRVQSILPGTLAAALLSPSNPVAMPARWMRSRFGRQRERAELLTAARDARAAGTPFSDAEFSRKRVHLEQLLHSLRAPGGPRSEQLAANYLRLVFYDKRRTSWFGFGPASGGSLVSSVVSFYVNRRYGGHDDMSDFSIFAPDFGEAKYVAPLIDVKSPWPFASLKELSPDIPADYWLAGHMPFDEIPLLDIGSSRILLSLRDVYSAAYSSARHHLRGFGFVPAPDGTMRDDDLVASLIRLRLKFVAWYNMWGRVAAERAAGASLRIVRFEDMKLSPVETFAGILGFVLERPIDEEMLREAAASSEVSAEKKRYDRLVGAADTASGQHRVGYQGAVSYREGLSPAFTRAVETKILDRLDRYGRALAERAIGSPGSSV